MHLRPASAEPTPRADEGAGGYYAARNGLAARDRSERTRLSLRGRAPEQVLAGLVSGKVPPPLSQSAGGAWRGRAEGSTLLTAKGRMIAELRLLRGGPTQEDGFLIDLPPECRDPALEHLRKFVPPRLARPNDDSSTMGMLTVLGPRGPEWLAASLGWEELQPAALETIGEGDLLHTPGAGGPLTIVRTAEVATQAFDVFAPAARVQSLMSSLIETGGSLIEPGVWETLRVEAGRPAFGAELDETTIPVEAGIQHRVVDYAKGCFTGQEVLIRIRDRGHVNRQLRGILMGQITPPQRGTPLFREGDERSVGRVTSAVRSPWFGEVIGLGFVRREVEPPARLALGSSTGVPVRVLDLESGWKPDGN
jgi:folate-binding protein YgfZ